MTSIQCVFHDGDARGLGLLFMVCACAVGLRGNRLIGMRGTWGVVWRSAHVPQSHSRDCLGQKPWAQLRMRPTTTPLGVFLRMRMFYSPCQSRPLIGRERSSEFFDDVFMLMSHVTTFSLSDWLRATFAALWLVGTYCSPIYYWLQDLQVNENAFSTSLLMLRLMGCYIWEENRWTGPLLTLFEGLNGVMAFTVIG